MTNKPVPPAAPQRSESEIYAEATAGVWNDMPRTGARISGLNLPAMVTAHTHAAVNAAIQSWRDKTGGPWLETDPIETFKLLNEIWNDGFEDAHALRDCGHSKGDFRDAGYVPRKPETYSASESCIGCAAVALQVGAALKQYRAKVQSWANNCAVYEANHKNTQNPEGTEYHRGGKEAFQRVVDDWPNDAASQALADALGKEWKACYALDVEHLRKQDEDGCSCELHAALAEHVRKARLDEAKWWQVHYSTHRRLDHDLSSCTEIGCERLTALEKES